MLVVINHVELIFISHADIFWEFFNIVTLEVQILFSS